MIKDKDKILSFLNLKYDKFDKSLMKIALSFDVAYTVVIIAFGLILNCIDLSWQNLGIVFLFIAETIFLYVLYVKLRNPAQQFSYTVIVLFSSSIKLFYGYFVFANGEYIEYGRSRFTVAHALILMLSIFLSIYVLCKFYKFYSCFIKNLCDNETKQYKKTPKWLLIISSFSPMIFVRLSEKNLLDLGIGVNFVFWALACIWFSMIYMLLPKCIVVKKYKVKDWFEIQRRKTGDGSLS